MPVPRLVVHIVLDDLGAEQVGRYGRNAASPGLAAQPFLDSLWDSGVRLTNYFAEAFCSPARACHMTGRHTEDTGTGDIIESDNDTPLLLDQLLLPEVLKIWFGTEIQTACIGKWHLGNASVGGKRSPLTAGFDYFYGSERNILDFYEDNLSCQGQTYPAHGRFIPEVLTEATTEWIRRFAAQRTKKGYLYVPFHLPHNPYWRPPSTLYNTATWTLPGVQPAPDVTYATSLPYFKAYIEAMDTLMARIWASVPSSLKNETLLLVSSDNGTESTLLPFESYAPPLSAFNYLATHGKRSYFDPGVRVPAYAYSTNTGLVTAPGRSVTGLVQSLDWYSTTLDAFGVPWQEIVAARGPRFGVSAAKRSKSIWPNLIANTATTNRTHAICGIFEPNGYNRGLSPGRRMITDGQFKFIFPTSATYLAKPSLYDIVDKPMENQAVFEPVGGSPQRVALQVAWDAFYASLPPVPS